MLTVDKISVMNIENAVRGARNPMNSHSKIDSYYGCSNDKIDCDSCCGASDGEGCNLYKHNYILGENDLKLLTKLCRAGSDHRKFMRQIFVSMDINAPLYWWKEFDTYKVGTTANSCSTMHFAHKRDFRMSDFSFDLAEVKTKSQELQEDIEIMVDREIWKDVKGYDGVYKISNKGEILKLPTETLTVDGFTKKYPSKNIVTSINSSGYKRCMLRKDGISKNHYLHRLIAENFIENSLGLPVVNHKDGNKLNNSIDNLEWVTHSENDKHAVSLGVKTVSGYNKYKVASRGRRFTDSEILDIFNMYEDGVSKKEISDIFDCYSSTICNILNGKTYKEQEYDALTTFKIIIDVLNNNRRMFVATGDKSYWRSMIQLLPGSYNQLRTVTLTYENLLNIYHARRNHKLTEWHTLCDAIEKLPYAKELIVDIKG